MRLKIISEINYKLWSCCDWTSMAVASQLSQLSHTQFVYKCMSRNLLICLTIVSAAWGIWIELRSTPLKSETECLRFSWILRVTDLVKNQSHAYQWASVLPEDLHDDEINCNYSSCLWISKHVVYRCHRIVLWIFLFQFQISTWNVSIRHSWFAILHKQIPP